MTAASAAAQPSRPPIALPERLTMSDARGTLERLLPLLASAHDAVLDASPLRVFDSAAVALLLACVRQAHQQAHPLRVIGAPAKLRQLATLYGLDELLAL